MPDKKLRVLLAEDHTVVREGLRLVIDNQPDMKVVGEASDGLEAIAQAGQLRPDVVVMDISMPKVNGISAAARMKGLEHAPVVLVLSVHEDAGYLREALAAGAGGYILKRSAGAELVKAIRAVSAGGVYLDPALAGKMKDGFVPADHTLPLAAASALSEREAEVLRLIASGYSNREIAAQLTISVKTVETYKARAQLKTGLSSRAEIVRFALHMGWLQE